MYTFKIKDNTPDINTVITRCLLALAAIAAICYRSTNQPFYVSLGAALLLLFMAIFINILLIKYRLNTPLLLIAAGVALFIATHSIALPAILIIYGLLVKKMYRQPFVNVNTNGVIINKMLSSPTHVWSEFNNIILKDNLLTLDFKDNKLLQLNILENGVEIDEGSFNNFCSGFIGV